MGDAGWTSGVKARMRFGYLSPPVLSFRPLCINGYFRWPSLHSLLLLFNPTSDNCFLLLILPAYGKWWLQALLNQVLHLPNVFPLRIPLGPFNDAFECVPTLVFPWSLSTLFPILKGGQLHTNSVTLSRADCNFAVTSLSTRTHNGNYNSIK